MEGSSCACELACALKVRGRHLHGLEDRGVRDGARGNPLLEVPLESGEVTLELLDEGAHGWLDVGWANVGELGSAGQVK